MSHYRPPQPVFIGGRQPFAPKLGLPQSGPAPSVMQSRAPIAVALAVIIASWQEPTTVISLASHAPIQVPDSPPVKTSTNLNLIVRGWYPDPYPSQGYGDSAPIIPAPAVPSQPPVIGRTTASLIINAWLPPLFIAQGFGELAAVLPAPAAPDQPPVPGKTTRSLIVASWKDPPPIVRAVTPIALSGPTPTDSIPDAFSFTAQTGVALSTVITSDSVTPVGYDTSTSITTDSEYEINASGNWVSSAGTISPGQAVRIRGTSSAFNSTETQATLTIGGVSAVFSFTTLAAVSTSRTRRANRIVVNAARSRTIR